jgi:prephenate dehydrogenase (NADP+)
MARLFGKSSTISNNKGLALLNSQAKHQIKQYSHSTSELFKLMIQEREAEFRARITTAFQFVFGRADNETILLADDLMDQYSLSAIPKDFTKANSHLSLLAIVDAWCICGINPYDQLLLQTPPFRLLVGIAEYLFRNPELLEESIKAALFDKEIRADDIQFVIAVQGWANVIELGMG